MSASDNSVIMYLEKARELIKDINNWCEGPTPKQGMGFLLVQKTSKLLGGALWVLYIKFYPI